jgi:hypothetical protein
MWTNCHLSFSRAVAFALGLVATATISLPVAAIDSIASGNKPLPGMTSSIQPNPLLSIDQNRATVVDRVVAAWGDSLVGANAGLTKDQLQTLLTGLRSDQLLAASLAGSLEGLRNVIANALTTTASIATGLIHTKALGDTADDLVYTPVTPCREVDTRNAGGQIGSNSSRDFMVWVSKGDFTAQGGSATNCNIPANPAAVVVNITAVSPAGAGNFIAYPTGTPTFTSVVNYQSGQMALANGAIVPVCQPNCTNQLTIATNGAGADLVMDIVGYFKPPGGVIGTVSNIATGTGLIGGPITTTGTISIATGGVGTTQLAANAVTQATLSPLSGAAAGKVLGTDGTNLQWQTDANSGGTVTNIATGTGLTGGPITTTGTVSLATSYQMPQSCTNGQVPKSNGAGGWACGALGFYNVFGTVTAVASGTVGSAQAICSPGDEVTGGGFQLTTYNAAQINAVSVTLSRPFDIDAGNHAWLVNMQNNSPNSVSYAAWAVCVVTP